MLEVGLSQCRSGWYVNGETASARWIQLASSGDCLDMWNEGVGRKKFSGDWWSC